MNKKYLSEPEVTDNGFLVYDGQTSTYTPSSVYDYDIGCVWNIGPWPFTGGITKEIGMVGVYGKEKYVVYTPTTYKVSTAERIDASVWTSVPDVFLNTNILSGNSYIVYNENYDAFIIMSNNGCKYSSDTTMWNDITIYDVNNGNGVIVDFSGLFFTDVKNVIRGGTQIVMGVGYTSTGTFAFISTGVGSVDLYKWVVSSSLYDIKNSFEYDPESNLIYYGFGKYIYREVWSFTNPPSPQNILHTLPTSQITPYYQQLTQRIFKMDFPLDNLYNVICVCCNENITYIYDNGDTIEDFSISSSLESTLYNFNFFPSNYYKVKDKIIRTGEYFGGIGFTSVTNKKGYITNAFMKGSNNINAFYRSTISQMHNTDDDILVSFLGENGATSMYISEKTNITIEDNYIKSIIDGHKVDNDYNTELLDGRFDYEQLVGYFPSHNEYVGPIANGLQQVFTALYNSITYNPYFMGVSYDYRLYEYVDIYYITTNTYIIYYKTRKRVYYSSIGFTSITLFYNRYGDYTDYTYNGFYSEAVMTMLLENIVTKIT